MRSALLLPATVLLAGCMLSYTSAGPTYSGDARREARLMLIADAPSLAGAEEAMEAWVDDPLDSLARTAVVKTAVAFSGPLEARFGEVSEEGRRQFFRVARTELIGDDASALIGRVSRSSGMIDQGIAALAGRQDASAVQSLLEMARGTAALTSRVDAVTALRPASTVLARNGLVAIATDPKMPDEVRDEAVNVLAPFSTPEVRRPLLDLAGRQDDEVSALIFDLMQTALDDAEGSLLLAATRKDIVADAAVRALDRTYTGKRLAPQVEARFLEMSDVSANAGNVWKTGEEDGRYEAAAALSRRDDARAYPALVRFLDKERYRRGASETLSNARIAMLDTLTRDAGRLTTARGRLAAAELVATFGGPQNAGLVRTLAPEAEAEALVARLPTAPWGLFPEGKVAFVPGITDTTTTELSILDAMRAGDALARSGGDPVTNYIGAARAYLVGSRSQAGVELLRSSGSAARDAFGLAVLSKVTLKGDTALGGRMVDALTGRIGSESGVKVIPRIEPAGAALTVTGALACKVDDTVKRERLPDARYEYTVQVHNAVKDELLRLVNTFPERLKVVEECTNECTYNPSTTAQYKSMMPCDYVPSGVDAVCRRSVRQFTNPEYSDLVERYNREPATVPYVTSVPMKQIAVTKTYAERCEGPLTLAVGAATHVAQVAYGGRSSSTVIEQSAQPVDTNGAAMPAWNDTQTGESYDDLKANFDAAVVAALDSYRPREPEVRRMYEDHVRVAVKAGDLRAARQALLGSQPGLIGADVAGLQRFREVFFSTGPGTFPAAWQ